jgi:hypothetical protein
MTYTRALTTALLILGLTGCAQLITPEQYVAAVSELGCELVGETDTKAAALLAKHGVTQTDLAMFRKKTGADMAGVVEQINAAVSACHGVPSTAPSPDASFENPGE